MLKPQSIRGASPPGPLKGLCPGPAGGLKRPPDTSSFSCAPPFRKPGYGPDDSFYKGSRYKLLGRIIYYTILF